MHIEILVEGEGLTDIEVVSLPVGALGTELVKIITTKSGIPVTDALLFLEDEDAPLDVETFIIAENMADRVHHVHRAREIEVSVSYQNNTKHKTFSPSSRIFRVLEWATGPNGFKIDAAIAPDMELALSGTDEPLPKEAHIGRFVKHPEHTLTLDLIRGVVPNGGYNEPN